MKVYGDAEQQCDLQELITGINRRIAATDFSNLEGVRALLIEAGQLEQAVADASEDDKLVQDYEHLTDLAADIFCALYLGKKTEARVPRPIQCDTTERVTVKIPEGFAFYALYPEQYCVSTLRWSDRQQCEKTALVIGLRTIGTTLSAVVNATLRLRGWTSNRVTVRANGHPFNRTVDLPNMPSSARALVVDEGPGMSGSSMAAVAEALRNIGFCDDQITFLPAHENGPGDAAPEHVRSVWDSIQIVTTKLADTEWFSRSLREQLSLGFKLEDCSGGKWRNFAYRDESEWPAVGAQFERMKLLCRGERGAVLWKYIGLVPSITEATLEKMCERARRTKSPAPLRTCNGFVATQWIEGERLRSADDAMLETLARCVALSAQSPMSRNEASAAIDRLKEMTVFNMTEAFGSDFTAEANRFIKHARPTLDTPTYGDGRMSPHEWVRTAEGIVWKTDTVGHDADHTLIGKQSVSWDIAGTIIEWNLDDTTTEQFVANCSAKLGNVAEEDLLFYQLAYAAFRLGFCTLNQSLTGDINEQTRLCSAAEFYGMKLRRLIRTSFSNSVTMLNEPGLISTRDI